MTKSIKNTLEFWVFLLLRVVKTFQFQLCQNKYQWYSDTSRRSDMKWWFDNFVWFLWRRNFSPSWSARIYQRHQNSYIDHDASAIIFLEEISWTRKIYIRKSDERMSFSYRYKFQSLSRTCIYLSRTYEDSDLWNDDTGEKIILDVSTDMSISDSSRKDTFEKKVYDAICDQTDDWSWQERLEE